MLNLLNPKLKHKHLYNLGFDYDKVIYIVNHNSEGFIYLNLMKITSGYWVILQKKEIRLNLGIIKYKYELLMLIKSLKNPK